MKMEIDELLKLVDDLKKLLLAYDALSEPEPEPETENRVVAGCFRCGRAFEPVYCSDCWDIAVPKTESVEWIRDHGMCPCCGYVCDRIAYKTALEKLESDAKARALFPLDSEDTERR